MWSVWTFAEWLSEWHIVFYMAVAFMWYEQ